MRTQIKYPVAISSVFLWIGFVCAISFLEAWLKFKAPGVTVAIGLGIGRLVFNVLNKIEWVFAIAIMANLVLSKGVVKAQNLLYFVPVFLLTIQTIWLLPALDGRAEMHILQKEVPPSNLHFYYVGTELVKVICLFGFGIKLLNKYYEQ